jgi:hypothetical protein
MTDLSALRAKDTACPKMTREQMQTEALIIENMLTAVQSLFGGSSKEDSQVSITLVENATDRAARLNSALDSANFGEVTA